ncbi:MAG: polysaccharide biosynthesis/export family protein [Thainema sp.]
MAWFPKSPRFLCGSAALVSLWMLSDCAIAQSLQLVDEPLAISNSNLALTVQPNQHQHSSPQADSLDNLESQHYIADYPVQTTPLPELSPGGNSASPSTRYDIFNENNQDSYVPPQAAPTIPTISDRYTLGPGDRVAISIFGAEQYSGEALILTDGTVNLPTAGSVAVQGLTFTEAADAISVAYRPYLRRAVVTVSPLALRPVRVAIAGAVKRPGSYTISLEQRQEGGFPTLTEAIQLAGGITPRANLREVEVQRASSGSPDQSMTVNLWELVTNANLSKDITLQSGDSIFIPTAEALTAAEAIQIGSTSISPETITVFVIGEVESPGPIQVAPNTPLNQALLSAGGFDPVRAEKDEVNLVRLNPDGTVVEREIEIDLGNELSEENNPALLENDVIVVGRSGLTRFSDSAGQITSPIGRILSTVFGIFNIFD